MAFASSVIPGFSLLEVHDQDFCSLLVLYVFRNEASSLKRDDWYFYIGAKFVAL
jgi:hypothetical protein